MLDRSTLSKVLALLGSEIDGEALAAARKAHHIVKNAGLEWSRVLGVSEVRDTMHIAPQSVAGLQPPVGRTWRETVRWLVDQGAASRPSESYLLDRCALTLSSQPAWERPRLSQEDVAGICEVYAAHMAPRAAA